MNRGATVESTIVETSLRFGVLCRFTAYVATDVRVVTDGGTPHKVTQLVERPAGWESHDMERESFRSSAVPFAPAMPAPSVRRPSAQASAAPMVSGAPAFEPQASIAYDASSMPAAPAQEKRRKMFGQSAGNVGGLPPAAEAVVKLMRAGGPVGGPGGGGAAFELASDVLPAGQPVAFSSEMTAVIAQAAVEAGRLRDGAGEPVSRRRDLLDDLASRLDALVHSLKWPVDLASAEKLRALVTHLRDASVSLEELWSSALAALDELAGLVDTAAVTAESSAASAADESGTPAKERRAFWKR